VAEADPGRWPDIYLKRFEITPATRISTAGSCFAQHIGRQLRARGFNHQDFEPPPPSLPPELWAEFGYGLFSARFGNIYTARQLLQLSREAFGPPTSHVRAWRRGARVDDPLRPTIEPEGFETLEELTALRLRQHLPAVRRLFLESEVLVFTLGLTEAWASRSDGTVYPLCPGVAAGEFDPDEHVFHNFSFGEVLQDMQAVIDEARAINPGLRFLLTVSPVPLTATASDQHVLVATTYSKSVLRAVAGELYARHDFVDYFPAYELVTAPAARGAYYGANLRQVTQAGVDHVMGVFFDQHGAGPERAAEARPASMLEQLSDEQRTMCDEEMLELVRSR
jgi:hypothetical protein